MIAYFARTGHGSNDNFHKKFFKLFQITNFVLLILFNDVYTQVSVSPDEGEVYPECVGDRQSPIAIDSTNIDIKKLPKFQMRYYDKPLPSPVRISNSGHTVNFNLPAKSSTSRPIISGSLLPGRFELDSFHFHWGKTNDRGSEHTINGKRYSIELHMVHINTRYRRSMEEAVKHKDGLVVLGVLYDYTTSNSNDLNRVVEQLPYVQNTGDERLLNKTFSMRSIFPRVDTTTYILYNGSLTTPPCSEAVTWVIFPLPTPKITESQLNAFRSLRGPDGEPIVDNYRALQPLNGRRIFGREGKYSLTQSVRT